MTSSTLREAVLDLLPPSWEFLVAEAEWSIPSAYEGRRVYLTFPDGRKSLVESRRFGDALANAIEAAAGEPLELVITTKEPH